MGKIYGNAISLGQTIGFTQKAPLDDRVAVETVYDLPALNAYEGLITYVSEEEAYYSYTGGAWHKGIAGQSSGDTSHKFMSRTEYQNLQVKEPDILYCIYEDSGTEGGEEEPPIEKIKVQVPQDYSIKESQLPYRPAESPYYTIEGDTIESLPQDVVYYVLTLKDPNKYEWSNGDDTGVRILKITVIPNGSEPDPEQPTSGWKFGQEFPIIL